LLLPVTVIEYNIREVKIVPYKIIHTGGKIHAGGCKNGFVRLSYHRDLYITKICMKH
jgi:hypothetical protein